MKFLFGCVLWVKCSLYLLFSYESHTQYSHVRYKYHNKPASGLVETRPKMFSFPISHMIQTSAQWKKGIGGPTKISNAKVTVKCLKPSHRLRDDGILQHISDSKHSLSIT